MNEIATIRATVQRAQSEGLGINECALRRWIKTGAIPSVQSGTRVYVSWSALLAYLGIAGKTQNDANSDK